MGNSLWMEFVFLGVVDSLVKKPETGASWEALKEKFPHCLGG